MSHAHVFKRPVPLWFALLVGSAIGLFLFLALFFWAARQSEDQGSNLISQTIKVDTGQNSARKLELVLKSTQGDRTICRAVVPLWYLSDAELIGIPMIDLTFKGCPPDIKFEDVVYTENEDGSTTVTCKYAGQELQILFQHGSIIIQNLAQLNQSGIFVRIE